MQDSNDAAVAILGIGRMATGLAVDLALNGCAADVIDVKPRGTSERAAKSAALGVEFTTAATALGVDAATLAPPAYRGDRIPARTYDYVFEALPEEIAIKQSVLAAMGDRLAGVRAVCSMTSTFTIEELTAGLAKAPTMVVTHFMNPPWLIPFLEVVTPIGADAGDIEALFGFLRGIGHAPIRCADSPGFVISRLQVALMNEAVRIMEEGVATPDDIDRAITQGWGYRFPVMGILEFIDAGGLDILYHGAASVARALGRPDLDTPELVARKYAEGALGVRSGKGLFDYGDGAELARREAVRMDRQVRLKALLDQFRAEDANGDGA